MQSSYRQLYTTFFTSTTHRTPAVSWSVLLLVALYLSISTTIPSITAYQLPITDQYHSIHRNMRAIWSSSSRLSTIHAFNRQFPAKSFRLLSTLSTSIPSTINTITPADTDNKPIKRNKRKVALVAGYVGSKYFGLQMDSRKLQEHLLQQQPSSTTSDAAELPITSTTPLTPILPTIEDEIRKALAQSQLISASNSVDLFKINWSRSSRTDKGVHANRIVFSLKIELPVDDVGVKTVNSIGEEDPPRYPQVIEALNRILPKEIQTFSCIKVNQGFVARDACHWRGYEYYMPIDILKSDSDNLNEQFNAEETVRKLNVFLKKMEGCHSFHNFHRLSVKELKGGKKKKVLKGHQRPWEGKDETAPVAVSTEVIAEDVEGVEEEEEEEIFEEATIPLADVEDASSTSSSTKKFSLDEIMNINGDHWQALDREMHFRTKGTIYVCEASLIKMQNQDMVKVSIVGQFFLLHQIRLMMSAAILCTRGVLPDYFIPMALQSPTLFRLPLAPAEGLVLSMAGFHRNSNGQDFSMASVTQSALREILLMTDEEYKASQQFQIDAIHPQILHDWFDKHNKNTTSASTYSKISNEDEEVEEQKSLLEEWRAYAARFTPSDKTLQTWQDLNQASQPDPSLLQEKERREYVRIQRSVQLFHQDAQDVLSVRKKPLSDNQIGQLRLKYPHRLYLPNSIASYLCVHFRIMPGSLISEALRALATRVVVANSDLVPPPVEQEEGVEGVEVQQEQAPPVRTSFPTDDKIRPSILCSIPQSIALIESEVKLLCKSNEEYEALTGLERLQLWTNAQPKHLFIG